MLPLVRRWHILGEIFMPDSVTDNLDEFEAHLEALVESFDFEAPGVDGSLADDIVDAVAEGIAERAIDQQSGAEGGWADNADSYVKRKKKAGKPVSVLSGEMISLVELRGGVETTPTTLTMTYGTAAFTRRRLEWFSNGSDGKDGEPSGAKNQPARPGLYRTDPAIDAEVESRIGAALERHIKGL